MNGSREDLGFYRITIVVAILMFSIIFANAFLLASAVAEETRLAGNDKLTTWTGEKIISGDHTIDEEETLVIEPGASITFKSYGKLIVYGTLEARGSPGENIDLIGDLTGGSLPQPAWNIEFIGKTSDLSFIDHCSIFQVGIRIVEASPTISNSIITNNSKIEISGYCSPVINNNVIRDNGIGTPSEPWFPQPYTAEEFSSYSGRTLDISCGTSAVISNNLIYHNGGYGIDIASASPVVFNNTIKENRLGGIYIQHSWWDYPSLPVIRNNMITDHGNSIASSSPPPGTEVYPSLRFNVGVMVENADCYFFDNTFKDNDIGVYVMQDLEGDPEFNNDSMLNNTIGVYSYSGSPVFQDCRLDNHAYDFWVEVYSHVKTYNTTFDQDKIMILGESKLETENRIYYPAVGGLGIIGFLLLLFITATEMGKYKFFSVFFPLYTRLSRRAILDQFVRGQLYGLIRGEPGIHYSKLKRVLKLGNGTLAHHLRVLEKEGFVYSKQRRLRKLFYSTEVPEHSTDAEPQMDTDDNFMEGIELSGVQERILASIRNHQGITQIEIASKLDVPKQTVSYNIKSLSRAGVVEVEKDGNKIRCYVKDDD